MKDKLSHGYPGGVGQGLGPRPVQTLLHGLRRDHDRRGRTSSGDAIAGHDYGEQDHGAEAGGSHEAGP